MLGWENLFHCEINPFGRAVLDYWYPNADSYEDITKQDFRPWRGRVDVLTGGFPCQPFSYAGQRRGQADDRYLWPSMFRCIDEVQPRWVVAENVAGILTMVEQGEVSRLAGAPALFDTPDHLRGHYQLRETFTLERICHDLESHGYEVQPVLIPACAVGAPHRRDRVFIVGRRREAGLVASESAERRPDGSVLADTLSERLEGLHQPLRREEEHGDSLRRDVARHGGATAQGRHAPHPSDARSESVRRAGQDAVHRPTDAPHADGDRGRKVDEHMEPQLADGAEPLSNGGQRNVADTEEQRSKRLRPEQPQDSRATQEQPGGRGGEGRSEYQVGDRWLNFPSVSPVHRGNDGLPFPVDDLTLSFGKWRTEALKAYGNAIVPQVMYEIFRAIEQVENNQIGK